MSIEYRGDNKYRFRVRKDGINYTQNYFGTEKEAENEHKKFEVDIMRGNIGYNENMKFAVLAQLVLDNYVKPFTSENTKSIYLYCYNNYALSEFGSMKISKIKKINIQKFVNELSKTLSYSTVEQILSKLKATFSKAIEWDIITYNPCIKIVIPNKEKTKNYTELLSVEEISRLLLAIDDLKSKPFKIIFTIAIGMGLRQSEILGLTIKDIDFDKNIIDINKQYARYRDEKGKYIRELTSLKTTNSYRKIYMPDFVRNILKEYIDNMKVINIKDPFLFTNPKTGVPYVHSVVYDKFSEMLRKNDIKHISFHDLRHLHATMLINNGTNIVAVAKRLGDTIDTVSNTYLHSIEEIDKQSANQLDDFIKKAKAN